MGTLTLAVKRSLIRITTYVLLASMATSPSIPLNSPLITFTLCPTVRISLLRLTPSIQIHHEHKILHLLIRHHQHGMRGKVLHIKKGDIIDVGYIAGCLLGGMNKHQITDYWNFATLTAILQLRNDKTRGKIIVKVQMFFRFKSVQRFPDCEFLLVTGAGCKPIFLLFSHLGIFFRMNQLSSGCASRFERDIFPPKPYCTLLQ